MVKRKALLSKVVAGHVLDILGQMPAESVSCVVTSPPYWSLRKYDAADVVWGGDKDCPHQETPEAWVEEPKPPTKMGQGGNTETIKNARVADAHEGEQASGATCSRCGAWRGQFGLEPTPELYVEHTLDVLRAIHRVLRPDGVVFWNIGDGYAAGGGGGGPKQKTNAGSLSYEAHPAPPGLKPKDLVLMPFRVALAAQNDSWWVRSVIIWAKPNAMPESVRDRPTDAHEYVLMLTKSARYWYDQEAVREAHTSHENERDSPKLPGGGRDVTEWQRGSGGNHQYDERLRVGFAAGGRNMRSVWTFPTAASPEAHFATFPEELPRRCIEASTPRAICVACGKPRVRLVERQASDAMYRERKDSSEDEPGNPMYRGGTHNSGLAANQDVAVQTLGWSDCGCGAGWKPGLVLDPFLGIGTTGVVAKRLRRRFVGIELSEKYAEMARENIARGRNKKQREVRLEKQGYKQQAIIPD